MRGWFQRGFALLLIMAVAVAGNLHLPLVQAVAWGRMYTQYREVYNAEASLRLTFSGQYPCPVCKWVAGAQKERDNLAGAAVSSLRVLLPFPQPADLVVQPTEVPGGGWSELAVLIPSAATRPEVPPPRWA
jgi:hypothetical protein